MSRILNAFIKGLFWGFVAFVHFALVTVLTFRFALNCLPRRFVNSMACLPGPGPAQCPDICPASSDAFFFILVIATVAAAVLLPLGFGVFWVLRKPAREPGT